MLLIFVALGVLALSGFAALLCGRRPDLANFLGAGGALTGCLLGLFPAGKVLWTGKAESFTRSWDIPYASLSVQADPLSSFFLLPILLLSAAAALYGWEYLKAYRTDKNLGASWFFFNLLAASMVLVVIARNGILFLMAWEIMSLASFFLVTFESEKDSVRKAGWIYLVATHIGTMCLFVLFMLLGRDSGSLDFAKFSFTASPGSSLAGLAFILALIGFGTKAGFMPFHVWLPEAHPAAPSHVSAVMSGVMIKTGIYGLLRTLTFIGTPEAWWGWVLIAAGLASGILGVLFALAQHDLKRLLAYSSVENIGIIGMGLGFGILGVALDQPVLAVLGLGGGLLHVLNHSLFKGLLFLGAGSVLHATGTRNMDRLGGLIKRMPWTAAVFAIGATAISGLPPLNGFLSEFFIYLGAFKGMGQAGTLFPAALIVAGLAIIGGLAGACFAKAFGIVFLGEPRSEDAVHVHEAGWAMRLPMLFLALACAAVAFFAPLALPVLNPIITTVTGYAGESVTAPLLPALTPLRHIVLASAVFLVLLAVLIILRRLLLAGREVSASGTWDCGYVRPTARIQYTASSFAQPLTNMFRFFLQSRRHGQEPQGLFPHPAAISTETDDVFRRRFYDHVFQGAAVLMMRLHWLQQGRVQVYVLYIAVTLLALFIWNLR